MSRTDGPPKGFRAAPLAPSTTLLRPETGRVERTENKTSELKIDRSVDRTGGTLPRTEKSTELDAAASIAPHTAIAATKTLVTSAARALEAIATDTTEPHAKTVLTDAANASRRTAAMASVGTPARIALTEDKRRPSNLAGMLERQGETALFRPEQGSLEPFVLPSAMVEGLPAGTSLQLKLERRAGEEQVFHLDVAPSSYQTEIVATVVVKDGKPFAEPIARGSERLYQGLIPIEDPAAAAHAGKQILVELESPANRSARSAHVKQLLGDAESLSTRMLDTALSYGRKPGYPADVMAEVKAILADPKIEGPDFTHLRFITIDNPSSTDLDQAMAFERRPDGGYDLHYAIADAAHFVQPGSAIDREALRRTETAYLPDRALAMIPPEISSGLCSLLPDQNRRAFIVTVHLDSSWNTQSTEINRGVIRSRAKLAYEGVQAYEDAGKKGPLAGKDWTDNLDLLRQFGENRVKAAEDRGMHVSRSSERRSRIYGPDGKSVELKAKERNEVEMWNEQVSLLVNQEIGRFLRANKVQALHRVHPPPQPEKMDAFRSMVAALGRPWAPGQELQEYLRSLDPNEALTKVIDRQSIRINRGASYSTEPTGHYGLKLEDYVHFTAPMRRYPDIVIERILGAILEGKPVPYQEPGALDEVITAEKGCTKQLRSLGNTAEQILAAAALSEHVGGKLKGVIMDVRPSGLEIELSNPPATIVVPSGLLKPPNVAKFKLVNAGTELWSPKASYRLGSEIELTIQRTDTATGEVVAVPSNL